MVNADDILLYSHVFAPQEGFISKIEHPVRQEICLNGRWEFQAIELPQSYQHGKSIAPELPQPKEENWDKVKIKIPSPWNINAFANQDLAGPDHRNFPSYPKEWENVKMAWMRKNVTVPEDWNNNKIFLHFEAVAGYTEVYVNGRKVAENFDLFIPFDADITSFVKPGEKTEILVGVRSQYLFEDTSTKGRRIVPAGSMFGYDMNGIWQDVFLVAVPKINISNVFIKPLVSKNSLELDVTIENTSAKSETLILSGDIREWFNKAGTDIHSAPIPDWKLATNPTLIIPQNKIKLPQGTTKLTIQIPVKKGDLNYWSPEFPNLYGLTLKLGNKTVTDIKYERFGWREWTFDGTKQLLNGKEFQLKGDSWHFMGVPQLTRRYAWAWFTALKDANANAVRLHAQVYPRFYFCEIQEGEVSQYGMSGNFVTEGEVLLNACNTDWKKWKKQPEEIKTASLLRSENEKKGSDVVYVKYPTQKSTVYVSTINNFTATEKGYNTLSKILHGSGILSIGKSLSESLINKKGVIELPNLFVRDQNNRKNYSLWLWSPRPLDNLLIEPNIPKLDIVLASDNGEISLNGKKLDSYNMIPLKQGWNQMIFSIPENATVSNVQFICENNPDFVKQLQTSLQNPNQ